jgi:hypothetical protein
VNAYELGYDNGKLVYRGKSQKRMLTHEEWERLPKLEFPLLGSRHERGRVYPVQKVGCYRVADAPLAIAVVDGKEFQLPNDLVSWVQDCIGLAMIGANPFPCDVAFSTVGCTHCAELLPR